MGDHLANEQRKAMADSLILGLYRSPASDPISFLRAEYFQFAFSCPRRK
jgi:hypothetical protein